MFARRPLAGLVVAILSLAAALPEASASPARRLARRGVLLAPPPGTAIVPPAGPLRPNPLLAVPVAPGGPSIVIGPAGRVRWRLTLPPGAVPVPGEVVTVTETVRVEQPAAVVAPVPPLVASPPAMAPQAAVRPSGPPPVAVQSPRPAPAPLTVESIPAPLPQPASAGGVVPAGAELEIPDGTQSVLVQPAGGDAPRPAGR